MSSQQIPNLLSLRDGPRFRGRGRGRGSSSTASVTPASSQRDQNIQATDTDAALSRLSAVSLCYLDDRFAQFFVRGRESRRLPIINRGTYIRTTALDSLIHAFLSPSTSTYPAETKQIISLGAGTDTRYFRLRSQDRHHNLLYHEFDFPSVTSAKYKIVQSNPLELSGNEFLYEGFAGQNVDSCPPPPVNAGPELVADWGFMTPTEGQRRYFVHPLDLRDLPSKQSLDSIRGIRNDVPTLIISECCLCYLDVDIARDVVKWFADRIPQLGIVLYEPIGTDDAFGQMMVRNLATRGIVMPTVQKYKTLEQQKERLTELGFGGPTGGLEAKNVDRIWEEWVSCEEKERVDGLEGLDEVEEWTLLARHYGVVWGWRGGTGFEGWNLSGGINVG